MAELRQQPRVVFSTKARIRPAGEEGSVVARVHNLSENGIYVTAPKPLPPGVEVRCRLVLGNQRRILRGRVAWSHGAGEGPRPSPESGAGIAFTDLSDTDAVLLRRLVSPHPEDEEAVDVEFSGLAAAVKCRAVVRRDGLRISTRLPFLRLGSEVKVTLERNGVRETRVGTLEALVMAPGDDDPVPRLFVSVSTPEQEAAGGVIEQAAHQPARVTPELDFVPSTLVDEVALGVSEASGPVGQDRRAQSAPPPLPGMPPPVQAHADTTPRPMPYPEPNAPSAPVVPVVVRPPERSDRTEVVRRPAGLEESAPHSLSALLGGAGPRPRQLRRVLLAAGAAALAMVGATAMFRSKPPPSASTAPAPAARAEAAPTAATPPPVPAAEAAGGSVGIDVEPLPSAFASAGPAGASASDPSDALEDRWDATALVRDERGFLMKVSAKRTEILVPLVGSTRRAQSYPLRTPDGIAVNLPHAAPADNQGRHGLEQGALKSVWIERKSGGAHLRFHWAGRVGSPALTIEPQAVRLVVDAE